MVRSNTNTIHECRCCDRVILAAPTPQGVIDSGWALLENVDGPNAICSECVRTGQHHAQLYDEYPNVDVIETL